MLEKELERIRDKFNLPSEAITEIRALIVLYYLTTISDKEEPISTFCYNEEDNIV